jgi:hypothetical protein
MAEEELKLEDSNLAGIGGEEDIAQRKAAAALEAAWQGAGEAAGIEVWRVENRRTADDLPDFGVARWPKEEYGCFYSGDSYLVMNTKIDDEGAKSMDLHYWLGESTSQDEMGVAAYKTVELDDLLDGVPIQFREVQGNESSQFLGYFPFIKYMEGGIASGFRHVKPEEYEPRLLHVKKQAKGKNMCVKQLPVAIESLNQGDAFVLDCGSVVYKWCGEFSSPFEKSKAALLQGNLINERHGKAVKGDEDSDEFWAVFGGQGEISNEERAKPVSHEFGERVLLRISDSSGSLEFTEVARGSISRDMLESSDAFIIDLESRIFVWVGANASVNERRQALQCATTYLQQNNKPLNIRMTRIVEGTREPPNFQYAFNA